MIRRNFLTAAAVAAFTFAAFGSAFAAEPVHLNSELKREISALKPLRGAGINNTAFDGRPVLVTFFASW